MSAAELTGGEYHLARVTDITGGCRKPVLRCGVGHSIECNITIKLTMA
jgi:hypothetical protein